MTDQDKVNRDNTRTSLIIALVFLAPMVLAWYLHHAAERGAIVKGGAEHGILINPPRPLENYTLLDPVTGMTATLYGKWTMLALIDDECGQECQEALYRMRQIRLATGDDLFRVQRAVFFINDEIEHNARDFFSDYAGQLVLPHGKTGAGFLDNFRMDGMRPEHALFLVDPRGFLMMCYPQGTDPSGIIKDMKRLLRVAG